MTRVLTIILIIFIVSLIGCGTDDPLAFQSLTFPSSDDITGLGFRSSDLGCAVTAQGNIYRTSDGKSFSKVGGFGRRLNEVEFGDDDIAIAVGVGGLIVRSTDDGQNWMPAVADSTYDLLDMVTLDDGVVIIIGEVRGGESAGRGVIGRSSDGGATIQWEVRAESGFVNIDAVPPDHLWILGRETLIYSTDGGSTWDDSGHRTRGAAAVYFTDIQHGWEVGSAGRLRYSNDAGWSWKDKLTMTEGDLTCVVGPEIDRIYIAGENFVAVTTTHGRQWIKDSATYRARFSDLEWVEQTVYLAGSGGTILKTSW